MDVNARLQKLTRLGFAVRGLLYIVIALLIITTGRAEDPSGALQYLGQGGGKLLLIVMTAGLLAYSLWRLSDAAFDIERHGSDRKGVMQRIGAAASGVVHLVLSWQAIRLIQGWRRQATERGRAPEQRCIYPPAGRWSLRAALSS